MAWSGYVALGALSNGIFSEVSTSDYARQPFAFGASVSGVVRGSGASFEFPLVSAGTAWVHDALAFYTSVTGGAPVLVVPHLTAGATVPPGKRMRLQPALVAINVLEQKTVGGVALDPDGVAAVSGVTPSIARRSFYNTPRNSGQLRSLGYSMATGNLVSAQVFTFSTQITLESNFELVRMVYASPSTTGFSVVLAKVAVSSALGDGTTSYNAAGSADFTAWQTVYFNNGGADVTPQDQATWGSGTTSFAVPGNASSTTRAAYYYSDWMRISSIARSDGGTLPILLCRTLTDSAGTFRASPITGVTDSGRTLYIYVKPGVDVVTTPAALTGGNNNSFMTPNAVQYMTRAPGITVLGVGDSLTYGLGSTHPIKTWGAQSCAALSTPQRPISFFNQGWSSQQSPDFWANGYTAFKAMRPDVVTFPAWTPNDGLTQAAADAGFSRAMDFADYARRNGAVPVLMGPLPWNAITTAPQEAARLSARTRMLEAAASGYIHALDWESVMGTGSTPYNTLIPAYNSGTADKHPNDLGNSVMDQYVFRPVLAAILGQ